MLHAPVPPPPPPLPSIKEVTPELELPGSDPGFQGGPHTDTDTQNSTETTPTVALTMGGISNGHSRTWLQQSWEPPQLLL